MGTLVGQYRITGVIGIGGMGAVYSAEHVLLGRASAVKFLLPDVSRDAEMVSRFFHEARVAATIDHPGIVEIARQIASALAAAHDKGVVHRDLKPDNIFLVRDTEVPGGERIKLLDFDIAKAVRSNDQHRTRTGLVLGTPTYMAPEQCRGLAVNHRADLYALGCILFELCAGRPPFTGVGDGDVLAAHIHVPSPAVSSLVNDLPPELDAAISCLLVKDREHRTQSAADVVQAMSSATSALDSSHSSASARTIERRSRSRRLRIVWMAMVAAQVALLLLVVRFRDSRLAADLSTASAGAASCAAAPPTSCVVATAVVDSDAVVARRQLVTDAAPGPISAVTLAAPSRHGRPSRVPASSLRPKVEEAEAVQPPAALDPPAESITAKSIAEQYAAVGRQLDTLRRDRGAGSASDLWPRYLRIRINEAIVDPEKRADVSELLRQLREQIVERSGSH